MVEIGAVSVEPRFASFVLDVVSLGERKTTIGRERLFGGVPGRLGHRELRHIGVVAALLAVVEQSAPGHEQRSGGVSPFHRKLTGRYSESSSSFPNSGSVSKPERKRDQRFGATIQMDELPVMTWRVLAVMALLAAASAPAAGAPFVPESDNQVLERLPFTPSDPFINKLRALKNQLTHKPDNLPLALLVAQGYLEVGRVTGDPRYSGYAQAALTPWWDLDQPPPEVLVLRATLRQRTHQFDGALGDLATVLNTNPRNVQARLMRATVLQVQGVYDGAREECRALQPLTEEVVGVACLASVDGATGKLRESYQQLRLTLDKYPHTQPSIRSWVLTSLAETAARAGMVQEADEHFHAALAIDAADTYILSAYADFLLDTDRPAVVIGLLRDQTRADPLLLRYALALQAQHLKELPAQVERLRDRFAASRLRGDRVHLREEARFTLHLLDAPRAALKLAQENWQVQKEPADVRILLEAALAAGDGVAVDAVKEWLSSSRLEDVQLQQILAPRG